MEIKNVNNNIDENPYLSITLVSRNDDHGGNMLQRMQASINGRLEQLEKYRIESELILVDWNPPSGRPLLKDVIQWPSGLKYCTIRVIEVPPKIHRRYKYHKKRPMHDAVASNTGIRRARGKFILPGQIDSLYTEELMSFIASKNLKPNEIYRADRCEVDKNVLKYNTLIEQLDFCMNNIVRKFTKPSSGDHGLPNLHVVSSGDFQLMARHNWHLLRGLREANIVGAFSDALISYAAYAAGIREVVLKEDMRVYHIDHENICADSFKADNKTFAKWLSFPLIPKSISFKLILLYRKYVGETQVVLNRGLPVMHWKELNRMFQDIVNGRRSYIINDNTWGLAGEDLKETFISVAEWENK